MDKEQVIKRIESLQDELKRLNVKHQTFTEMICHMRDRRDRVEQRKRQIHYEIEDIKAQVKAWEQAKTNT